MPSSIEKSYPVTMIAPLSRKPQPFPAAWYTDPASPNSKRLSVFPVNVATGRTHRQVHLLDNSSLPPSPDPSSCPRQRRHSFSRSSCLPPPTPRRRNSTCGQASFALPLSRRKYGLDGSLKGMPEFEGVENFAPHRQPNGLVPSASKLGVLRLHHLDDHAAR